MRLKLITFLQGKYYELYATTVFDNKTVIKRCHEINGSPGSVPFDLTYHISLEQHDYNVKVLNNFNTHLIYR